ncbi:MAG: peptidylprolyl isomerase [Phycisphaerales bacterium]|nr:peptidylprolyl isomerase [Phycisphaerales bacterium]
MTKLPAAPALGAVPARAAAARTPVAPRRGRRVSVAVRAAVETLERRSLLSVAVGTAIANTSATPGAAPTDIDLAGTFDDTAVAGTVVRFDTSLGNVDIELFDQAARKTAQNFVNYVANNLYNQTVIHRLVRGFILQGGGYLPTGAHIPEGSPVANEFSAERSNLRGTIAMAKLPATDSAGNAVPGGGPDSATSEWFINLADNPGLDAQNGGYTVFGQVINGTLSTVDAIAALPIDDATALSPVFAELPVRNLPATGANPGTDDFVFLDSAAVIPDTKFLTITAVSDAPTVVAPTVADGVLRLNYGPNSGSARITVTATDAAGNAASQTFTAGVGEYQVQLGAGGVGSSLNFTDADGGIGTVSIAKGGTAFVRFAGTGLSVTNGKKPSLAGTVTRIAGITTLDAGTNTTLSVTSKGGDGTIEVGGITADTPLKTVSMKSATLTGTTTIGGTVRSIALGSMTGATVTLGGDPSDGIALDLTVGTATDSSVTSGEPIKRVAATEFLATSDAVGTIAAPTVSTVTTKGALRASINSTGAIKSVKAGGPQKGDITADSIGTLSAASLEGGLWTFAQAFAAGRNAVGKIAVKGSITGTTIRTNGNVGSLSAGSVVSGRLYAGADVTDEAFPPFLPDALAQFTTAARLASVKVTTKVSQFSEAAASLGTIRYGEVATDDAIGFGLSATEIGSLVGVTADTTADGGAASVPFNFRGLSEQAAFDAQVATLGLPLGNFQVRLF